SHILWCAGPYHAECRARQQKKCPPAIHRLSTRRSVTPAARGPSLVIFSGPANDRRAGDVESQGDSMRTASAVVALVLACTLAAHAQMTQTPPSSTTVPPAPLPPVAPPGMPQIAGRAISLDEAVAIGLSNPNIQARLFDYAAA